MGFDLPGVIGCSLAVARMKKHQQRVIAIAGDGSIMMNLQELQTIKNIRRPISIFIS
jgi:acetolactate synthase-1/2/3 large subunit